MAGAAGSAGAGAAGAGALDAGAGALDAGAGAAGAETDWDGELAGALVLDVELHAVTARAAAAAAPAATILTDIRISNLLTAARKFADFSMRRAGVSVSDPHTA